MDLLLEIKLLKGFSNLNFGASKESAQITFGEPQEIQVLNDDILSNNTLVYHYWDLGFSLFFDMNKNNTLCSVEIDNKETVLFEAKLFSLKEKELISLLEQNGFQLSDTEVHQWGEKRVSFDAAVLDCYYENNRLVSVNFGCNEEKTEFKYFPN